MHKNEVAILRVKFTKQSYSYINNVSPIVTARRARTVEI